MHLASICGRELGKLEVDDDETAKTTMKEE